MTWLVDGALQLQPHMFTVAFFGSLFQMADMSLPSWLSDIEIRLQEVLGAHPAPWDVLFAGIELALGAGLIRGRAVRVCLAGSVAWGLAVWLSGEGLGGITMPSVDPLTGAPGAAGLYALVAVLAWPRRPDGAGAAAESGLLGRWGARLAWAAVWIGTALLWARPVNHMSDAASGQIFNADNGGPGFLMPVNHVAGNLVGDHGTLFAVVTGLAQAAAGLGIFWRRTQRPAVVLGVALAVFFAVFGQVLGGLFTGQATDPGTGPILVILAAALWPGRRVGSTQGSAHDAGVAQGVAAGLGPDGQTVGLVGHRDLGDQVPVDG